MKKMDYRKLFIDKVKHQLHDWEDHNHSIPAADIYKFLHTVAGTAGTIGLNDLSGAARNLLEEWPANPAESHWPPMKVQQHLSPLMPFINQSPAPLSNKADIPDDSDQQPLVLLIDQDVSLLIYLKAELEKEGWTVIVTSAVEKAVSLFYDLSPDCVVSDASLGLSFISKVRETVNSHLVPLIILSYKNDKEERMKCFQLGADDYMVKPVEIDELYVRINRQLRKRKQLTDSLLKDELTKVYNRKFLSDVYERICLEHKRSHAVFSVMMADLDHFKKINDTYGHLTGDKVLKEFAALLKMGLSDQDVIVRYGGEEFLIIFPFTAAQQAKKIAESLLQKAASSTMKEKGTSLDVTFSAGIYETDGQDSLDTAIKKADSACYMAKDNGRSQVVIARAEMEKKRKLKVALIDDSDVMRKMLQNFMGGLRVDHFELDVKAFENGLLFFEDEWHKTTDQYLIILDGVLPKMDGTEVLQKLRSYQNSSRYTILMLTGRKDEQDIVRALNLGADDYMTKPFSIRELEARIKILVQRIR